MENLPTWVTLENVLFLIAGLEAFIGAIPNHWVKYRSYILRAMKAIVNFIEES